MFACRVTIQLKSNALRDFTNIFENAIIPMLRKQPGFRDEITFASDNGTEITTITLWDGKQQVETYNTTVYPAELEKLGKFLDGKPHVRVVRVLNSTAHKLTAAATITAA